MNKEKLLNLDNNKSLFLKGIAILLVLIGHTFGSNYKLGVFGVNLFLILSGYGIYKSFNKNGLKDYFKKKIEKVYIPYLLVTIAKYLPFSCF